MAPAAVTEGAGATGLETADVQGLVLSGYARMREARYLFLEVVEAQAARRWLRALAGRVTSGAAPEDRRCLNVAVTGAGLARLGVRTEDLRTFPAPLREGMGAPYRQRVLGDLGPSAPENWRWGGPTGPSHDPAYEATEDRLHVLLLLYAPDRDTLDAVEREERAAAEADGALAVVHEISPERLRDTVGLHDRFGFEHFGFADGMSQPVISGTAQADRLGGVAARRDVVATGEFVLGYPNGYNRLTPSPVLRTPEGTTVDVATNGSYLVVRQLAQDVAAFRRFVRDQAAVVEAETGEPDPDLEERLAAKLVGRWRSGAPLVESWHRDDPDLGADNGFGYLREDPDGRRCPFGAHIRRSNPRDGVGPDPAHALERANLHRVLRRGRVYGKGLPDGAEDDDGVERGLVFIAVNANLERQFEFVQQTWINNPKFGGLYDEQDPLLGTPPAGGGRFTVQGAPFARRLRGLPSFVTVKGGAYFFLPGIRGLRALADLT